jgi:hypothetical protein
MDPVNRLAEAGNGASAEPDCGHRPAENGGSGDFTGGNAANSLKVSIPLNCGADMKTQKTHSTVVTRQQQLIECNAKLAALLAEYGAKLQVVQVMTLMPDGTPRYQFQVAAV